MGAGLLVLLLISVPPGAGRAENIASIPTGDAALSFELPDILSTRDRDLYRAIFAEQEDGHWAKADRLIRQLDDKVLMGHVLAQRYLHPTKYRSRYKELHFWLKEYADHPDARRIYKLALRRRPRNWRAPERPTGNLYPSYETFTIIEHTGYRPGDRAARNAIARVRRDVRHTRLTYATKYINTPRTSAILGRTGYDLARSLIASGWFFYGDSEKAFAMAHAAAARSGNRLPYAHWIAGLSAYRLGRYLDAADHFEKVAMSDEVTGWDHAAAAFWAARANMTGKRPERVKRWLLIAAEQPRTFYGIIARRWLGAASPFNWSMPDLTRERLELIAADRAGRRALALIQVGMNGRAGRELRFMKRDDDQEITAALIAIADRVSLPVVSFRTGTSLSGEEQRRFTGALYPLPAWEPREGFRVDRALIFAFMRQESAFNTRARSPAGARGLMQLMPATAGFVAQRRFTGSKRNQLYDPALNLSLGQKYILHLLDNDHVGGDLLLLAAAYNGGPGNLMKWKRRARRNQYTDALMFIESIPARETRIFIERVLSNLWMYRERLREPAPSLDALAAGERPIYIGVEGVRGSVAEDVRN